MQSEADIDKLERDYDESRDPGEDDDRRERPERDYDKYDDLGY